MMLDTARGHADAGRFAEMLAMCRELIAQETDNADQLLTVGALLLQAGYRSRRGFSAGGGP